MRVAITLASAFGLAAPAVSLAQSVQGDCELDSYRERIERTLASLESWETATWTQFDSEGRQFSLSDVSLSGTIDGCVVLEGPIPALGDAYSWLYDVPDVSLPQEHLLPHERTEPYPLPLSPGDGNTHPRYYATGAFLASDGAGITFVWPDPADWNGHLFIVQHGSGVYTPMAPLFATGEPVTPFPPYSGGTLFADVMAAAGFAVATLRKDAIRPPGGVSRVTIQNGRQLTTSFAAHVALPLALTEFAQQYVAEKLGRAPHKTFYYGHSGGGITGRLINQALHANLGYDGTPIIDGILNDDAGNGLYLPIAFVDGEDTLFEPPQARDAFVPQIDITRQLYNPLSYRVAKRLNATLLLEKGLGDRHRHYEIAGSSHFDAGMMRNFSQGTEGFTDTDVIDLSGIFAGVIGRLHDWVVDGATPPASRADGSALNPPEVSCPLGTYFSPADRGGGLTRLAAFDGTGLEPEVDSTTGYLDMNGNGVRDRRETVEQAWRRLGLLGSEQPMSAERYSACLDGAARELIEEGFLVAGSNDWYASGARGHLMASGALLR